MLLRRKILFIFGALAFLSLLSFYQTDSNHSTHPKVFSKSEEKPPEDNVPKVKEKPTFKAINELEGKFTKLSDVQHSRVTHLRSFCEKHPELSGEDAEKRHEMIRKHLNAHGTKFSYVPGHEFLECRVAKSGTTMRSFVWWSAFHGGKNIHDHPYYHPVNDPDIVRLNKVGRLKLDHALSTFTSSMFAREPLHKIISAFFNKFCDTNHKVKMKKFFEFPPDSEPMLADMLKKLASDKYYPVYSFDDHFTSYFNYCAPCLMNFNFIGRFESLKADINYLIYNKTDIHKQLSYSVDTAPVSPRMTDCKYMFEDPMSFYGIDIKDVETLMRKHRFDYEAFGYDPQEMIDYIQLRIKIANETFAESKKTAR